jgi:hypothetical protein
MKGMEKKSLPINDPVADLPSDGDDLEKVKKTPTPEQPAIASKTTARASEDEYQYVTSFKLTIVMVSVTLVGFLIMLDTSIISTVRFNLLPISQDTFTYDDF